MKTVITVSLDHKLVHALRETGSISQTINQLLTGHLFGGNSKEGLKAIIKGKKAQIKKINKEIKMLEQKQAKMSKFIIRHE